MSPANGGRDTGSCSCSPDLFSASTAAQEEEREGVGRTLHERETMDSSIFAFLFFPDLRQLQNRCRGSGFPPLLPLLLLVLHIGIGFGKEADLVSLADLVLKEAKSCQVEANQFLQQRKRE